MAFRDELGGMPFIGDIDTAVHEFGHMLFMPFGIEFLGHTMMVLGGSLFQVAFPLIFAGYFLWKREDGIRRDPYAAMLCFWWSSINLLHVSIYCADSRNRDLILLSGATGMEDDGHDWYNLLSGWGLLKQDLIIAHRMRMVAVLVCVGSLIAAAWIALNPRPVPVETEPAD